jgi:hypothetical protein
VGASWGNLATGSKGRAIAPAKIITNEQTVAKTGRLIKILEILSSIYNGVGWELAQLNTLGYRLLLVKKGLMHHKN